jgi:adenylate cyclase
MMNGWLRRAVRRGSFGSDETRTFFRTDAPVGDPSVELERLVPVSGSQRVILVHNGPGASVPENGNGHAALEGDVRQVSVLMADLRGFTTFCERVPPGRMSRLLNEYLTAMVDVILGHRGRVQDFVGDGILGVFGAPGPDPDHAWHATLSALEMQVAIRRLSGQWTQEGESSFALGVAVHSGEVFAGAVGSPKQSKYAVVGDPVNTVARLEELNRNLGTEIVISGDTFALVRDRIDAHPRGSFAVRGRNHDIEVFELLGVSASLGTC